MGDDATHADDFTCRDCQRSPAVQLRVHLARARAQGMPFERAWGTGFCDGWAFERVRWPHDTPHRRDWKAALAHPNLREAFRAAYCREKVGKREVHLANLELVA